MAIDDVGCLESAQWLEASAGLWDQQQLLRAAGAAVLRNTGWPIGLVLTKPDVAPRPTADGIEWHFGTPGAGRYDYWSFDRQGRFYFLRTFEEDWEDPTPTLKVWWDLRLWRIAETILHSATLYRELGVLANTPYLLKINHVGIANRELLVNNRRRSWIPGRFCSGTRHSWQRKVTQDVVQGGLKDLVDEVSRELFVLFDFAELGRPIVDEVVDEFLKSRLL